MCDNQYHSNDTPTVALSTGWFKFNNNKRCLNYINIYGNGKSVQAKVVDECDSTVGLMLSMITSFHVLTILLMPLELFGGPWECQEVNGETLDISWSDAQYKSNHTKVFITALISVQ